LRPLRNLNVEDTSRRARRCLTWSRPELTGAVAEDWNQAVAG
jgi:hypothetical protein